jgi:hypothetical protein
MEAKYSSETSVDFWQIIRRYIPGDGNLDDISIRVKRIEASDL